LPDHHAGLRGSERRPAGLRRRGSERGLTGAANYGRHARVRHPQPPALDCHTAGTAGGRVLAAAGGDPQSAGQPPAQGAKEEAAK
jgi:hypothetical protein